MARNNTIIWIIVALLAFTYVSKNGLPDFLSSSSVMDDGVDRTTCEISTATPDIDINAYDKDNPGTAVTDAKNLYRKVGSTDWVTWTLGTEITDLEYGGNYEFFIPGDLAETNLDANAFGPYQTFTGGCKPDTSKDIKVVNDETYDGLSETFYNEDHNAAAQTFSANDKKTIELVWKAGSDEYYGHPFLTSYPMLSDNGNHRRAYPNILCLKLNSTSWDEPESVRLGNGVEMREVSVPNVASADSASTHLMYCYEAPVMSDVRTSIFVDMDAKAVAPTVDDTAFLYAGNIYFNSDTTQPAWGVEDNDNQYVGGNADADEMTLDFT